jgi:hypothetical protein
MDPITRRSFGKTLLATVVLPHLGSSTLAEQAAAASPAVPDTIAGHVLTADEKVLTAKFLADQEKNLSGLRLESLPNSLQPAIRFASPTMKERDGARE